MYGTNGADFFWQIFADFRFSSGKEKAHKHKQIFPVTARAGGGGSPDRVGGGVSRPVARGPKFMCCARNPRNINVFVRVPGREESGSRPGGSVTGVTEKLFMCQMFMCLFRPLFPRNYSISEAQIFADFRRKPQETADFRRNPFVPFSLSLLSPPCLSHRQPSVAAASFANVNNSGKSKALVFPKGPCSTKNTTGRKSLPR